MVIRIDANTNFFSSNIRTSSTEHKKGNAIRHDGLYTTITITRAHKNAHTKININVSISFFTYVRKKNEYAFNQIRTKT